MARGKRFRSLSGSVLIDVQVSVALFLLGVASVRAQTAQITRELEWMEKQSSIQLMPDVDGDRWIVASVSRSRKDGSRTAASSEVESVSVTSKRAEVILNLVPKASP